MCIHLIPLADTHLHAAQMVCPCHPVDVGDGVVAHNAWDTREAMERVTGENAALGGYWCWRWRAAIPNEHKHFRHVPETDFGNILTELMV